MWWAHLHIRDPAWLRPIKGRSATPARIAPVSMLVSARIRVRAHHARAASVEFSGPGTDNSTLACPASGDAPAPALNVTTLSPRENFVAVPPRASRFPL